jgi:hypothetical protein
MAVGRDVPRRCPGFRIAPRYSGRHPRPRPTAGNAAFAKNRSEVLGTPDQLRALQRIHSQIYKPHCDDQRVAEDRSRLAADIGEIIRTFLDELMAAGWSETEARDANIGGLAGSHAEV